MMKNDTMKCMPCSGVLALEVKGKILCTYDRLLSLLKDNSTLASTSTDVDYDFISVVWLSSWPSNIPILNIMLFPLLFCPL
jgi:hypothetical protein